MTHPLKWTLLAAQKEFGAHRDTLKAKLIQAGVKPDADDTYSTKQILIALQGDYAAEKLRKVKEEADKLELENRRRRGELLDAAEVKSAIERICFIQRQNFMLSGMPPEVIERNLALNRQMESLDFSAPMPDES